MRQGEGVDLGLKTFSTAGSARRDRETHAPQPRWTHYFFEACDYYTPLLSSKQYPPFAGRPRVD